jgi:hypothetical protein
MKAHRYGSPSPTCVTQPNPQDASLAQARRSIHQATRRQDRTREQRQQVRSLPPRACPNSTRRERTFATRNPINRGLFYRIRFGQLERLSIRCKPSQLGARPAASPVDLGDRSRHTYTSAPTPRHVKQTTPPDSGDEKCQRGLTRRDPKEQPGPTQTNPRRTGQPLEPCSPEDPRHRPTDQQEQAGTRTMSTCERPCRSSGTLSRLPRSRRFRIPRAEGRKCTRVAWACEQRM